MKDEPRPVCIDEIVEKIEQEVRLHLNPQQAPKPEPEFHAAPDTASGFPHEYLAVAEQNIDAGKKNFPMRKYPWPIRWAARLVGRLVIFFNQVVTIPQNTFNQAAYVVMRSLARSASGHSDKLANFENGLSRIESRNEAFGAELNERLARVEFGLDACKEALHQNIVRLDQRVDETDTMESEEKNLLTQNVETLKKGLLETSENLESIHLRTNEISNRMEQDNGRFAVEFEKLAASIDEKLASRDDRLDHMQNLIEESHRVSGEYQNRIGALEDKLGSYVNDAENRFGRVDDTLSEEKERSEKALKYQVVEFEKTVSRLKSQLGYQEQRLQILLGEVRKRLPKPLDEHQLTRLSDVLSGSRDDFYWLFEEEFRGSREIVKARQKDYLEFLEGVRKDTAEANILDIGCGRGEWLELLGEKGFQAKGVDLNEVLIDKCVKRGLNVEKADAFDFLERQDDASYSVVTAFHIIEHLGAEKAVAFLKEILRIVEPGGVAIIETPNPENILVSSFYFYYDLTHKNPIPPSTLVFLVEYLGFVNPEILRFRSLKFAFAEEDHPLKNIADCFNAAQDYAIVAYKP